MEESEDDDGYGGDVNDDTKIIMAHIVIRAFHPMNHDCCYHLTLLFNFSFAKRRRLIWLEWFVILCFIIVTSSDTRLDVYYSL